MLKLSEMWCAKHYANWTDDVVVGINAGFLLATPDYATKGRTLEQLAAQFAHVLGDDWSVEITRETSLTIENKGVVLRYSLFGLA